MRRTIGVFLLCCAATPSARVAQSPQEPTRPEQAATPTTQLQIRVTGGDGSTPVGGATVYIEWDEQGEQTAVEGRTNRQGTAGPYRVPRVKVFVQVTTNGDEWENNAVDRELNQQDETISITLAKKPSR